MGEGETRRDDGFLHNKEKRRHFHLCEKKESGFGNDFYTMTIATGFENTFSLSPVRFSPPQTLSPKDVKRSPTTSGKFGTQKVEELVPSGASASCAAKEVVFFETVDA